MKICEIFHSIQGEGVHTGRWATFVRFAVCNLRCNWCDTKYAWDDSKAPDLGVEEVCRQILKNSPMSVIFTGGEPMLYQEDICLICNVLSEVIPVIPTKDFWFAVETNGLILPDSGLEDFIDHYAISPKLHSACTGGWDLKILMEWLFWVSPPSMEFKFVIGDRYDLEEVIYIYEKLHLRDSTIPVILQPNGQAENYPQAARELVEMVAASSLHNYVRVMLQTHRVIWGGERGK